jgi:beta-fructofuranosidase
MVKPKPTQPSLIEAQETVNLASKTVKNDTSRPRYHAACPANWMNDPNGPILYKEEIHLFYQHYPLGPKWNTMHWGHMKTKDLIHWEDLPIAFGPSYDGGEDHCYSGCCIMGPDGKPTAIYTSIGKRTPEHWIAIGSDDMLTWEKYEGNPVMDMEIHEDSKLIINDWRDPYVWKSEDGMYYCVIGGHIVQPDKIHDRNPAVFLYKSLDLRKWNFLGPITSRYSGEADSDIEVGVNLGHNFECPNFFKIVASEDKWLLLVSPHGPVTYSVGTFNNNKFDAGRWQNLDHSGVFYAPNSLVDQQDRNIVIGWMRMDFYETWNGCFSLPRVVQLNSDQKTITALPIPEIQGLRDQYMKLESIKIENDESCSLLPSDELNTIQDYIREKSLEILIKIQPTSGELRVPSFTMELFTDPELSFSGLFGYDGEEERCFIGNNSGIFKLAPEEKEIALKMYIDRSVIEIFINDRWAISQCLKITPKSKLSLKFNAEDEKILINSVEFWGMKAIN